MSAAFDPIATRLGAALPGHLDLTSAAQEAQVMAAADEILATGPAASDLAAWESGLVARRGDVSLAVQLAAKLALSRRLLRDLAQPVHLGVVFAVYREEKRILPAGEATGGEDFLVRKMAQLDWLVRDCPDAGWDLTVVDDGCPAGSGEIARGIIAREGRTDRARVLDLADAIAAGHPVTTGLAAPDQSRKGGSIQLGMYEAVDPPRTGHVVVFTDADLSTHLGQTGLLAHEMLQEGHDVVIGSRRLPESIVIKPGGRNDRGKLFIYLWKRMVGILPEIIDTQCGFKAFRGDLVRELLHGAREKRFAFDLELLIRARLRRPGSIAQRGIAWIDSDALSTTTDLQPYLPMLEAIAGMARRYLPPDPAAEPFITLVEGLDEAAWNRLLENIPAQITSREPGEFARWAGISAEDLARAAG